jgi:deoxyribodipyrimidine photo-lyase
MYIFVHHSDLRIVDNRTLNHLIENKLHFQPIFIGTPDQLENSNHYKSDNSIRFMVESLEELSNDYKKYGLHLSFYFGETSAVLNELIKINSTIEGIANNRGYSPYAIKRDEKVLEICKKHTIEYILLEDSLLNPVEDIVTGKGTEYTKYTPYFNNAHKNKVDLPIDNSKQLNKNKPDNLKKTKYDCSLNDISVKAIHTSKTVEIIGGRSQAIKILDQLQTFDDYNKERNTPTIPTTRLSAYLKFGCVSPREAFYAVKTKLGSNNELIKQLYWRDFYHMILYYYGSFDTPISITKDHLNDIKWNTNADYLKRWKDGMTGCPIVDAGMREMNSTGFMHNRLRMIVASYLIFFLRIDWREGMTYFSQKLVDIDWANNVGNWQWTAGVEKWSNDYYKVFSMESQAKRFDPECIYIKKWVPELNDIPAKDIIEWDLHYSKHNVDYPNPIIENNKDSRKMGIAMYKEALAF